MNCFIFCKYINTPPSVAVAQMIKMSPHQRQAGVAVAVDPVIRRAEGIRECCYHMAA
jgi:hypothetical protein